MRKLIFSRAAVGRLIIGIALVGIGLQVNWSLLPSVRAEEGNRAGLVIQHGDGSVSTQCISFAEETTTGLDLLVDSGLDLNVEVGGGMGTAICRIDNEGCDHQRDGQCFCQCISTLCTYWNYWKLEGENWVHSDFGASNSTVRNGDVDAWTWSTTGDMTDEPEVKPPLKTFLEICEPENFKATQTAVAAAAETATASGGESPTSTAIIISAPPMTPTPEQQPADSVIVISAPPNTPTDMPVATPTPTPIPTDTPIPASSTAVATNTPTETVADNAIPDSSAPAESAEVVAVADTGATEVDSSASEPQLLTIFMGMIFIMAVPLILGMAWMGFRSFGGKRQ